MGDDDKDRFGEKLRQKEKAEEDRFYAERDKEALEKLRRKRATGTAKAPEHARNQCPQCGERLTTVDEHGVKVEECPAGHGLWVAHHEIETIARRERDSWLGRFFYRPKR